MTDVPIPGDSPPADVPALGASCAVPAGAGLIAAPGVSAPTRLLPRLARPAAADAGRPRFGRVFGAKAGAATRPAPG
jgi:hypothetical protein